MSLAEPLSVGTCNVRWDCPDDGEHRWEQRRERLTSLLRSWGPDVLGLQEPYRHQLDYLRQVLPEYDTIGVGRNDSLESGEFCAIFYRRDRFQPLASGTFWLADTPDTPGAIAWGARHPRICTWVDLVEPRTDTRFSVYNVHLDHESQTARENGVALLLDRLRPGPTLVLGDFNAAPDNPAVQLLLRSPFPGLASALAPRPEGTFHGFSGKAAPGPIDYIFYSPEWQALSAQVLHGDGERPYPSDHFPVSAVLQLK
jgi:endonuclease/exonuclease/phosphatase family metal-dependent hydrolase